VIAKTSHVLSHPLLATMKKLGSRFACVIAVLMVVDILCCDVASVMAQNPSAQELRSEKKESEQDSKIFLLPKIWIVIEPATRVTRVEVNEQQYVVFTVALSEFPGLSPPC
jgi:hypothetical protein